MPNTPNASFIPKQGPVRKVRQTASRQVHLFTIISYVLFASTLSAAAGVTLYNRHLNKQLEGEAEKLSAVIGGFSDTDMNDVREFNLRLMQAQGRLDKSVSLTSIFDALEDATLKAVGITELSIKREEDTQVLVSAKLSTDSFDSSLFQRGVYERNPIIKGLVVTDITLKTANENEAAGVSFLAKIPISLSEIPYTPTTAATENKTEINVSTSTPIEEVVTASSTTQTQ